MPRQLTQEFSFSGLNTKAVTTGLPVLDSVVLQDLRVVGTDLVERLGISRVAQFTGNAKAGDLDRASSEEYTAAVDPRVWALGTKFTIEALVNADLAAGGNQYTVFQAGHTTPSVALYLSTTTLWTFSVWDSSGASTVLTTAASAGADTSLQLVRDGASLTMRVNNVVTDTDTMSAVLALRAPAGNMEVGAVAAASFFDGKICYVRAFNGLAKSSHADRMIRNPAPRAKNCVADYDFNESAGGLVYDRSRYANHLVATNTPTEATPLSHNPAPMRAVSMNVDPVTNRKQLLLVCGGLYYLADYD